MKNQGYEVLYGPEIACDGERPERKDFLETVLVEQLRRAVARINPG